MPGNSVNRLTLEDGADAIGCGQGTDASVPVAGWPESDRVRRKEAHRLIAAAAIVSTLLAPVFLGLSLHSVSAALRLCVGRPWRRQPLEHRR